MIELIINQSALGLGIICSLVLFTTLKKHDRKLPEGWRGSVSAKNFQQSILFLFIYMVIIFLGELIAISMALQNIYNSFVIIINYTLHLPFLLGFLFINTQTSWKKYTYILLYFILIGYFISEGLYHPRSILMGNTGLLMYTIHFLAALLHLTDLLVKPKSDYFRFQLKINLCILIYSMLATVITSFSLYDMGFNLAYSDVIYQIHFYNIILFYMSLTLIFIVETFKLRRE